MVLRRFGDMTMTLRRRVLIGRLIVAATWAVGTAGLLGLLFRVCFPFRGAVMFAVGRATTCGLREAVRSPGVTAALYAAKGRARATSRRVIGGEGRFELWETEQGPFWISGNPGMAPFTRELAEQAIGYYEGDGLGVRPGDIVLDCGAHYGSYTRRALKAGARLVVAIEPEPDNLECLRRNLAAEIEQGRVILYSKGVWDRAESLPLHLDLTNSGGHSVVMGGASSPASKRISLTTIDAVVSELRLPRVDYIKMDIEGAEQRALAGARETLKRFKPRMAVAVYHLTGDAVAIPRIVTGINPAYRACLSLCLDHGERLRPEVTHFY